MPITDLRPILPIIIGLITSILILAIGKRHKDIREAISLISAILMVSVIITMLPQVYQGTKYVYHTPELISNVSVSFMVDQFSIFFSLLSSSLWFFTTIYSIGYMRGLEEHSQTRYYSFFAICIASTVGIAHSSNLFSLFIFYELLTIATYPLVIHDETQESIRAGKKYLAYTLTGGILVLFGLIWTYVISGSLAFTEGGLLNSQIASFNDLRILFTVFILGFGVKSAIMPLHGWLPTAMIAPTPVSALLHCVAVVKSGCFGIVRVVLDVFGPGLVRDLGLSYPLAFVASVTIIVSMIIAYKKDHLKAKLAYSTINELSYIVLGVAFCTQIGIAGGIVHIFNHAHMKIGMFFFAGAIFVQAGKEYTSDLDGIGKRMPISTLVFTIGALSLAGTPPLVGFISKWYLISGSIEAEMVIYSAVLIISALLNVVVFWPIIYRSFFKEPEVKKMSIPSKSLLIPMLYSAVITIIFGIFAQKQFFPLKLAFEIAKKAVGG
ncbi:MAG: Multisubunit Na+/H+ antiporter MnhD subunit [Candidatus Methanohalarchaeum thermophilum]|uniref:Multisubunit Na+/H+ antiporter MnhD subunit n=1 Tax=Methanohalarchaeum thermophilum TaxID=1903181 RepID=A0A1Q6DUT9_METT1|nr:MAG: Multisubunit Na+/H+ antiporter MnhD subunit [Candidatus Methanohalarchaeum thermophilum]